MEYLTKKGTASKMKKTSYSGWILVYRDEENNFTAGVRIFNTKEEAEKHDEYWRDKVAIKIEWETSI